MEPFKDPLTFSVFGADSVVIEAICAQIVKGFPNKCIGNTFDDIERALLELRHAPPDLILLHSQKHSDDMVEIHNAFLGTPPPVILLLETDDAPEPTSIHPSIIQVMKTPFENKQINHSITKVLNTKSSHLSQGGKSKGNETILLSTGTGWQLIKLTDIVRLKSDGNYITFHTVNKEKLTVIKTLKYFEQKLPSEKFFRVHQSHIINFMHIQKVITTDGYSILMSDGASIPLSKEKREPFKKFLQQKCIS